MKKLFLALAVVLLPTLSCAQIGNVVAKHFAGVPTGGCSRNQVAINDSNGDYYDCQNGSWHKVGPSAGGSGCETTGSNGELLFDDGMGGCSSDSDATTDGSGNISATSVSTGDGSTAGALKLFGAGSDPTLPANSLGFLGPSTGTFTKQFFRFPSSAPGAAGIFGFGAPSSNVSAMQYLTRQGDATKVQMAGTISGTGATLCTDANGNSTTSGCSGGGGGAGYARLMLADVTLTSANTAYDYLNLPSLAAASYEFKSAVNVKNTTNAAVGVTCKLWDGTTVYASGEITLAANGGSGATFGKITMVGSATLGSTTTVRGTCYSTAGSSAIVAIKAAGDNGAGNNASSLTAVVLSALTVPAISVSATGPMSCTMCDVDFMDTSETFSAVVTNDIGSAGVTWALGTLACGSINSTSGVYNATGGTPCAGGETGTIIATSVMDTSKTGTVTVNITGGGGSTPDFVQAQKGEANDSTTVSTTAMATTAGNALAVGCLQISSSFTFSVTNTGGDTFTPVGSLCNLPGTSSNVQIFYAKNIAGNAADQITCTSSSQAVFLDAVVFELSGASATTPLDQGPACGGSNTGTVSSASFTTTAADEVLVSFTGEQGGTSFTAGSGYTIPSNGASRFLGGEYKVVHSIQTGVTSDMMSSAAVSEGIVVGTFK